MQKPCRVANIARLLTGCITVACEGCVEVAPHITREDVKYVDGANVAPHIWGCNALKDIMLAKPLLAVEYPYTAREIRTVI